MSELPNQEIEGRLNAQREALALIIAHLVRLEMRDKKAAAGLLETLEEHSLFQDHQEDPGAVPAGGAFAVEAAMMEEFRRLLREAQSRLAELGHENRPPAGG